MRQLRVEVWYLLTREHPKMPAVFIVGWSVIMVLTVLRGDGIGFF